MTKFYLQQLSANGMSHACLSFLSSRKALSHLAGTHSHPAEGRRLSWSVWL